MTFSAGASAGGGAVAAVGGAVGSAASAAGSAVAAVGGAVGAVAGAAVGVATALGSLIPASLFCTDVAAIGVVPFDFNPEKITISRTAKIQTRPSGGVGGGSPSGSSGGINNKTDPPTISMSDLIFEGLTTKLRCDTLMRWTSNPTLDPVEIAAAALGLPQSMQPPTLTFMWGPPLVGFFYEVLLKQVTVVFERFNPMGIPVRAKVSLTLLQQPSLLADLPTNPTSGGVAGRRTHILKDGDSLQSLSTAYYGRPGLWRQIARVNHVDNPRRLRPGTTIYLPGMGELTEATG